MKLFSFYISFVNYIEQKLNSSQIDLNVILRIIQKKNTSYKFYKSNYGLYLNIY
jgi:hypothetical protein